MTNLWTFAFSYLSYFSITYISYMKHPVVGNNYLKFFTNIKTVITVVSEISKQQLNLKSLLQRDIMDLDYKIAPQNMQRACAEWP